MAKSGRKQVRPQGENAALRTRLERTEKITSALVADVEVLKQRLSKVEVVRAPSPTTPADTPQEPYTGEPVPEEAQKPETE